MLHLPEISYRIEGMDGYGFNLNELKDDKKLKNDNYEIWERLIPPFLFVAGAHEMVIREDNQPPLPKPTITVVVGTPTHKDQKDHLDRWNTCNQAENRQSTSIWMWDKRIGSCSIKERL